MSAALRISRRALLGGGSALVVAAVRNGPALGQSVIAAGKEAVAPHLPGSLKQTPRLDAWIEVGADGAISVLTGKGELGQGIKTALLQVAAEELGLSAAALRLVTADTGRTPNEGYTAGSRSMQDSATAIRHAAACVRTLLVEEAARAWDTQAEGLRLDEGAVAGSAGRRMPLSEIVARVPLDVEAPAEAKLRSPDAYRIVGHSLPRSDIPGKIAGGAAYVQDIRLPGMVHARIVRPPRPGARLVALDAGSVAALPGVVRVHRDGNFLAVVATREYGAVQAMRALGGAARWEGGDPLPDPATLFEALAGYPAERTVIHEAGREQSAPEGRRITARYRRAYQMHASIGPSCALAQFEDGRLTVWTHAQGVFPLRKAIAEMLGMEEEAIRCIHAEGSGCYGHNGADDAGADAALLARALPGRPVRVQYMREQEHLWEPYGGAMIAEAAATLGPDGRIRDWDYAVRSPTHLTRPPGAGQLLPARHLAEPFAPPPPKAIPQPEGGGDRNAIPLYALPRARIAHDFVETMPLRVSALRGLGAYANVFAIESFMDELAQAAGQDPVAFRLAHLDDPRARAVIEAAAERFAWGRPLDAGRGAGFAFARYKNSGAYAAVAVEAAWEPETTSPRLIRVQAAVDAGQVVNPHGIRDQVEGGIIQSMSWTLYEAVRFDSEGVRSRDWSTYPIARFPDVPERIDVHLIDRAGQPFLGTGEAVQGPLAAALANAVTGAGAPRPRDLPFRRIPEAGRA